MLRREFDRCGPLHRLVLHYLHALIVVLSQSGACNRFHSHSATPLSLAADVPGSRAIQRDPVHSRTPVADAGSQSRERQSSGQRLAKGGADQLPAWPDHHPRSLAVWKRRPVSATALSKASSIASFALSRPGGGCDISPGRAREFPGAWIVEAVDLADGDSPSVSPVLRFRSPRASRSLCRREECGAWSRRSSREGGAVMPQTWVLETSVAARKLLLSTRAGRATSEHSCLTTVAPGTYRGGNWPRYPGTNLEGGRESSDCWSSWFRNGAQGRPNCRQFASQDFRHRDRGGLRRKLTMARRGNQGGPARPPDTRCRWCPRPRCRATRHTAPGHVPAFPIVGIGASAGGLEAFTGSSAVCRPIPAWPLF